MMKLLIKISDSKMFSLIFNLNNWKLYFSFKQFIKNLLSSFSALWLLTEILAFFIDEQCINFKKLWPYFILIALVWTLIEIFPKRKISHKISGLDANIELLIGNLFDRESSLIIPTNSTFDTDLSRNIQNRSIISEKSVQGQFTTKYFKNKTAILDDDLEKSLTEDEFVILDRSNKKYGKQKEYKIGTVAALHFDNHTAYWVAMAKLNSSMNAESSDENILIALSSVWNYISTKGNYEEKIIIPIIGTGFSRINSKREDIIKLIISSFIAAMRNRKFCQNLTIAIHPTDYVRHEINLKEVEDYLRLNCKFNITNLSLIKEGTAIR